MRINISLPVDRDHPLSAVQEHSTPVRDVHDNKTHKQNRELPQVGTHTPYTDTIDLAMAKVAGSYHTTNTLAQAHVQLQYMYTNNDKLHP